MTFDLITADAMGSGFADHWCSVNDGVSGFVAVELVVIFLKCDGSNHRLK